MSKKSKDPNFPFEKPIDKARDMFHDGYTLDETLFWVEQAWKEQFDRELTKAERDEIYNYYDEVIDHSNE